MKWFNSDHEKLAGDTVTEEEHQAVFRRADGTAFMWMDLQGYRDALFVEESNSGHVVKRGPWIGVGL